MSAGWLYYHRYPPKRKCPTCGTRHYLKRVGVMSNGEDVWKLYCTKTGELASTTTVTPFMKDKTQFTHEPDWKQLSSQNHTWICSCGLVVQAADESLLYTIGDSLHLTGLKCILL